MRVTAQEGFIEALIAERDRERELADMLGFAAERLDDMCAPLARTTAGDDDRWEMAVRDLREALTQWREARKG